MVKRFDREVSADKIERLHQEDFCQALGVMPSMKYEAEGGPGFKDCFQLVRQKCGVPAKEMKQLLAWVIYNYLLGNADAHAKNVSLLYMGKAPTLAPFYDLMSTQVYGKQLTDKMAMKIGKEKRLDHVMPRHWRGFAEDAGLRSAMVLKELEKMAREMPGKAEEVFGDFEKEYGPSEVCHRVVELIEKRARTAAIRIEVEQDLSWREGQSED
jgi:serine/threonine-protein kinase HipA